MKIGPASAGTVNTLYGVGTYAKTHESIGYGPLADAANVALGSPTQGVAPRSVLLMRSTASTAATVSSVTVTRIGSSTGTVATTGSTPFDKYSVRLTITTTGTLGTAAFVYSLDGGRQTSAPTVVPSGGTYVIENSGVTVVFTAGGGPTFFEAGDVFTFTTTAPASTTSDLDDAFDALLASSVPYEFVHVVGPSANVAGLQSLFDAVATQLNTFEARKRYISVMLDGAEDTTSNLASGLASRTHRRILVAAKHQDLTIPDSGMRFTRPVAWTLTARAAGIAISDDVAFVALGELPNIPGNSDADPSIDFDSDVDSTLDDARYSTLRQWTGLPGVYPCNARMFSPPTSDFRYWQHRRVMDAACRLTYAAVLPYSSVKLRTTVKTLADGSRVNAILDKDADRIETKVNAALRAGLSGHVTSVAFAIDRESEALTTERMGWRVSITPFAYGKESVGEISFVNPAAV